MKKQPQIWIIEKDNRIYTCVGSLTLYYVAFVWFFLFMFGFYLNATGAIVQHFIINILLHTAMEIYVRNKKKSFIEIDKRRFSSEIALERNKPRHLTTFHPLVHMGCVALDTRTHMVPSKKRSTQLLPIENILELCFLHSIHVKNAKLGKNQYDIHSAHNKSKFEMVPMTSFPPPMQLTGHKPIINQYSGFADHLLFFRLLFSTCAFN